MFYERFLRTELFLTFTKLCLGVSRALFTDRAFLDSNSFKMLSYWDHLQGDIRDMGKRLGKEVQGFVALYCGGRVDRLRCA